MLPKFLLFILPFLLQKGESPAQGVWPNPAEQRLAAALAAAGIPVQAQVGVSKYGGHRRGGWFAGYWLDCAHRDVRYGLRIDVELDGRAHLSGDRPLRDAKRNMLLQLRGWYVVRLPGSLLHTAGFDRAVAEIAALAVQHRRAVVLARSDVGQILQDLAAAAPPATPSRPSETVSPAAPVIPAAVAPRPAAQADLMAQRPLCPRCGHPLVRRMARQGPHAGQPFYGCAGYPQCRYTQSISSSATPGP